MGPVAAGCYNGTVTASSTAYDGYEGFLREAIRRHWESRPKERLSFLSLLLATREAWQVAWDKATRSRQKLATGAAGAAAVAVLLRTFAGGPLGFLLTSASIASLVALYAREHDRVRKRADQYRGLVAEYQGKYASLRNRYVVGEIDQPERDLMIDGLLQRFLQDLESSPSAPDSP